MTGPEPRRGRGDEGQVGGIEVLPLGFLVFVGVTLLLAGAWGVLDARMAVGAAAREAARAVAEADDGDEALSAAHLRATETLRAFGRDGDRATVDIDLDEPFGRCVRVVVTVSYRLPAVTAPYLGRVGSLGTARSTFTELVDPFRSGLDGPATC